MSGADRSILLVDDHAVVREGYRSVLQKQPGLRVVAEAADGAEAYRLFKEVQPDLVIMDLSHARHRRHRGRQAHPAMGQARPHPRLHDAPECGLRRAGDPRRREGLCHQDQPAGDAGACGDGRARRPDRHQPGHRPRACAQPACRRDRRRRRPHRARVRSAAHAARRTHAPRRSPRRCTSVPRRSRTCTPSSRTSSASAPTSSWSGLRCVRKF